MPSPTPSNFCPWLRLTARPNPDLLLGLVPFPDSLLGQALHWVALLGALCWLALRCFAPSRVRMRGLPLALGYAFILAGAVANLAGRASGGVVDPFAVGPFAGGRWLFFNIADLEMFAGLGIVTALIFASRVRSRSPASP